MTQVEMAWWYFWWHHMFAVPYEQELQKKMDEERPRQIRQALKTVGLTYLDWLRKSS